MNFLGILNSNAIATITNVLLSSLLIFFTVRNSKKSCKQEKEIHNRNVLIAREQRMFNIYHVFANCGRVLKTDEITELAKLNILVDTKEFVKAKDFLNKKCKEVWDVFENKNTKLNLPYEAMKTLGITNQPSLETLLADSLKYYEKDNGSTTVDVILSILANENINYTFDDVYEYLKKNNKKQSKRKV